MAAAEQKDGKKAKGQKLRDCCRFFWNCETGEVLGRSGKSWGLILVFYLIYYGMLAGFFAICLIGFFKTMDDNAPTQQYLYSLLKQNPGMGFRPKLEVESTLIKFVANESSSYDKYIQSLEESLQIYAASEADNKAIDCSVLAPGDRSDDDVCRFSLSVLGDSCTAGKHFGYAEGKPCVLLKMNRVYGWNPVPFDNETGAEAAQHLGNRMDSDYVGVTCDGEIEADVDNIRGITYYPEKGFPSVFFPYLNQPGYLPPVVMAQFDIVPGRLVMVWCKVWAKNIKHHRVDLQGSVHFELLVDYEHM